MSRKMPKIDLDEIDIKSIARKLCGGAINSFSGCVAEEGNRLTCDDCYFENRETFKAWLKEKLNSEEVSK